MHSGGYLRGGYCSGILIASNSTLDTTAQPFIVWRNGRASPSKISFAIMGTCDRFMSIYLARLALPLLCTVHSFHPRTSTGSCSTATYCPSSKTNHPFPQKTPTPTHAMKPPTGIKWGISLILKLQNQNAKPNKRSCMPSSILATSPGPGAPAL